MSDDWNRALLSIILGSCFSLIATLLANINHNRNQLRLLRQEKLREKYKEVESYVWNCLEFSNLTKNEVLTAGNPSAEASAKLHKEIKKHLDSRRRSPLKDPDYRYVVVGDEAILKQLAKIDVSFEMLKKQYVDTGIHNMMPPMQEHQEIARAAGSIINHMRELMGKS